MDEYLEVSKAETRPRRPMRREKSEGGSWQAEKSYLMQTHILDATMRCLVNIGYTQTTTEKIAKEAGVSRGAMTHHFKSRAEVFAAAAAHITDIRVMEYDVAIKEVSQVEGSFPTLGGMLQTLKALQSYYMKPSFLAFHELLRGARTDPELNKVMAPLEASLDERISVSMVTRFPIWAEAGMAETGEVLRDLVMHTLQGVALNPSPYLQGDRLDRLHEMLAKTAMNEFRESYNRMLGDKPQD
ncbi:TetR/AcrR family transcriptional regulator [Pseudomonas jinjuensis]|nr:TetR/AcrR family transcriptional regulator [Pseudomonas jinjuensis]